MRPCLHSTRAEKRGIIFFSSVKYLNVTTVPGIGAPRFVRIVPGLGDAHQRAHLALVFALPVIVDSDQGFVVLEALHLQQVVAATPVMRGSDRARNETLPYLGFDGLQLVQQVLHVALRVNVQYTLPLHPPHRKLSGPS